MLIWNSPDLSIMHLGDLIKIRVRFIFYFLDGAREAFTNHGLSCPGVIQ